MDAICGLVRRAGASTCAGGLHAGNKLHSNYLDNVTFCHCEPSEAAKQSQRRHEGIASAQKARLAMTDTQSNIVELLTLAKVRRRFAGETGSTSDVVHVDERV
jgi:hypothetical protein